MVRQTQAGAVCFLPPEVFPPCGSTGPYSVCRKTSSVLFCSVIIIVAMMIWINEPVNYLYQVSGLGRTQYFGVLR